jgi:positive regulator of sigma E activity
MGETELIMDTLGFSLEKGDKIEVGIEEKKSLIASLITFFFPVIIFISVLLFLKKQGELFSFILAILAVMSYYLTVKVLTKDRKEYFNLKVLRKL